MVDDWFAAIRAGGAPLESFCRYVRSQSARYIEGAVPALRGWAKPTLVVCASHDRFLSPSWGVRLCEDIPGAPEQPVMLPFAGHFSQADVPRTADVCSVTSTPLSALGAVPPADLSRDGRGHSPNNDC